MSTVTLHWRLLFRKWMMLEFLFFLITPWRRRRRIAGVEPSVLCSWMPTPFLPQPPLFFLHVFPSVRINKNTALNNKNVSNISSLNLDCAALDPCTIQFLPRLSWFILSCFDPTWTEGRGNLAGLWGGGDRWADTKLCLLWCQLQLPHPATSLFWMQRRWQGKGHL